MSARAIPQLVDVTPSSAKSWMEQMIELGLFFHPDDDPSDIIYAPQWDKLFSDDEAVTLREIISRLFTSLGDQVYEIGCDVLGISGPTEPN